VKGKEALNTRIDNSAMNGNIPYDKAQEMKSLPYTERTEAYIRLTGNRAQEARQNKTLQFDSVSTGNELTQQFKDYLKSIGKNDAYITRISELNNKRLTGTLNDKEIAELGSAKGYIDSLDSLNANAVKPSKSKGTQTSRNYKVTLDNNPELVKQMEAETGETYSSDNLRDSEYSFVQGRMAEYDGKTTTLNAGINKEEMNLMRGRNTLETMLREDNYFLLVNGEIWDGEEIPDDAEVLKVKRTSDGKPKVHSWGSKKGKYAGEALPSVKSSEDGTRVILANLTLSKANIKTFNEAKDKIAKELGFGSKDINEPSDATGVDATDADAISTQDEAIKKLRALSTDGNKLN
jgi:hypothetical protein